MKRLPRLTGIRRLGILGGGGAAEGPYLSGIKSLFGANLVAYWPLSETTGTNAADLSGNERNGVYEGPTLAAIDAPAAMGGKIPSFDGLNDRVNVYGASLAGAINPNAGTYSVLCKLPTAALTDGVLRYISEFRFGSPVTSYFGFYKSATNNRLACHVRGLDSKYINMDGVYVDDFLRLTLTYDVTANRLFAYLNGVQVGTFEKHFGALQNALATACIGCTALTGYHSGYAGHAAYIDRVATPEEVAALYTLSLGSQKLAILGDSIEALPGAWPLMVSNSFDIQLANHAVSGQSIAGNIEGQATAAAADNANVIVIGLGTNDNNSGDMVALQAKAETGIAMLQASNPGATIYWMNVLPRWTAADGLTEVDKSNIRAAVAAACAAKGVTCWDSYTDPWILAVDTSDGVHPNALGQYKIYSRIKALL